MFHYLKKIRCRLQDNVIMQVLLQIHYSNLNFIIDFETLNLLNLKKNVCHLCHQYCKQVNFYIRHLLNFIIIYL